MKIIFILVEPKVAENIGASARAIKTMGFPSLRLVKPADHLSDQARWLAHGSNDILENAELFETLSDAISDIDLVIASAAKQRHIKKEYHDASKIPAIISNRSRSVETAAIVFGREESGLTNEELMMCDIITSVPMATMYPSLNLSQAVMIYAYILSSNTLQNNQTEEVADESRLCHLKERLKEILNKLDIEEDSNLYKKMISKCAFLKNKDIKVFHAVLDKIERKLN